MSLTLKQQELKTATISTSSTSKSKPKPKTTIEQGSTQQTQVLPLPQKPKRRKCRVTVDISSCRYAIIRQCLRERDFRLIKKPTNKWDIWWSDRGDKLKEIRRLNAFQKVNHFPCMEEICRKDFLSNNLNGIYKILPEEYDFFPRSFLIPAETIELQKAMEKDMKTTYIVKVSIFRFSPAPSSSVIIYHSSFSFQIAKNFMSGKRHFFDSIL
jgi:hypothetical protein